MYIKKQDFDYVEKLLKELDGEKQQKFLALIQKGGSEKAGSDISQIKVIDDSRRDTQVIEATEMVTRTMIKKAYKAIKEGNPV
ncbi:MAG: hypothetical protein WC539_07455 [Nitrospirota bacterium]